MVGDKDSEREIEGLREQQSKRGGEKDRGTERENCFKCSKIFVPPNWTPHVVVCVSFENPPTFTSMPCSITISIPNLSLLLNKDICIKS